MEAGNVNLHGTSPWHPTEERVRCSCERELPRDKPVASCLFRNGVPATNGAGAEIVRSIEVAKRRIDRSWRDGASYISCRKTPSAKRLLQ